MGEKILPDPQTGNQLDPQHLSAQAPIPRLGWVGWDCWHIAGGMLANQCPSVPTGQWMPETLGDGELPHVPQLVSPPPLLGPSPFTASPINFPHPLMRVGGISPL